MALISFDRLVYHFSMPITGLSAISTNFVRKWCLFLAAAVAKMGLVLPAADRRGSAADGSRALLTVVMRPLQRAALLLRRVMLYLL